MSDTAIYAVIALASALLTLIIRQLFESRSRRSEERRWYAEFFLQRKIEALQNAHGALVACYNLIPQFEAMGRPEREQFDGEIRARIHAYQQAQQLASVYLDEEGTNAAYGAALAIEEHFGLRILDWERSDEELALSVTYAKAKAALDDALDPDILRQLEKGKA